MCKYSFNKDYFKKIDTQDKAYFLGLMYADGYNSEKGNYAKISLKEEDLDVLEKFKYFTNSNNKLTFFERSLKNSNWSNNYTLQFSSKVFSKSLSDLGCVQNKSKILKFPSEKIIPIKFQKDFIRGYFDGDGCVWEGKKHKIIITDKKYGKREKIIHNVKFTITGTEEFIIKLQDILIFNLKFKKNKLNTRHKSKNSFFIKTLEYSGRLQMKKFYNFIYNDSFVYMNRKKKKFENIIMC